MTSYRPFSTFSLDPFLSLSMQDQEQLQRAFLKLSRQFHPDSFVHKSEEEKEAAEAKASSLNADFAKLKNFWKRLDAVLENSGFRSDAACARSGTAPEFAADYFELQELHEESPDSPETKRLLQEFVAKIDRALIESENTIQRLAERYPLGKTSKFETESLLELRKQLEDLRYYKSFKNDLLEKFKVS